MEYRKIGCSELEVSAVGLGCNNFGMRIEADAAKVVVDKAIGLGVTFFDTAEMYGMGASEEMLGAALGDRRQDVVIATKFGMPSAGLSSPGSGSREYIVNAVDNSLKRLGTDYIDLYMIHFPDPETSAEETAQALDELVQAGKVRHVGISNVSAAQTEEAQVAAQAQGVKPYISVENEWSLVDRAVEEEVTPTAVRNGCGVLPYFPLAGGFLTGKYRQGEDMPEGGRLTEGALAGLAGKYINDRNWGILAKAEEFAEARGHSVLDLAIGWLLAKPGVPSVISGATKPEQVDSNVNAASWQLSAEEVAEIDALAS